MVDNVEALRRYRLATTDAEYLDLAAEMDAEDNPRLVAPNALAGAAQWYAMANVAVFPVRPGEKTPATRNGFKDATTDVDKIAAWWNANPNCNVGLPTGGLFDVIDVDGWPGHLSLLELQDDGKIPETFGMTGTPNGGRHLYVPPTGSGNGTRVRPGIDYRGAGGYVLAPPSRIGKRHYWWIHPLAVSWLGKV